MARAEAEVAGVRSEDRVVGFEAVRELPYLQACIKEALRIHTPIPMALPRPAPKEGLEIGGRCFPEGITVSASPWVLHRSRALWGEDADEFKPERWLGDDVARLEKNFVPFGAGFMACPGQHLAKMEALKITATLLRDYDLSLVEPEKEWECKMCFAQVPRSWPVFVTRKERARLCYKASKMFETPMCLSLTASASGARHAELLVSSQVTGHAGSRI